MIEYLEPKKLKSALEYEGLMMGWKKFNNSMLAFMKRYDVIISPVMPSPAMLHDAVPSGFSSLMHLSISAAYVLCSFDDNKILLCVEFVWIPQYSSRKCWFR
jgi:hypothetical protein